jgi:uncharacterized damage-inducible protein DinB
MKEILQQYAAYNHWAHQKLTNVILSMDDDLHQKPVPSSYPSLYATVLHTWDAECIWWQRTKLEDRIKVPSASFNSSMKDAVNGLLGQSKLWEEFVSGASELKLNHVFEYRNSHKEIFKQPLNQVLLHVFNHSTYHRGQLVTMMRLLGATKIPPTDFIVWSRGK